MESALAESQVKCASHAWQQQIGDKLTMFVIGKAKTPLRLNSVKVYSVVTKIKGWMDGWSTV